MKITLKNMIIAILLGIIIGMTAGRNVDRKRMKDLRKQNARLKYSVHYWQDKYDFLYANGPWPLVPKDWRERTEKVKEGVR